MRIIAMLFIIGHHMVVNSGVTECYDYSHITPNMIFLQIFGAWGKTMINPFVMITGYFMCTSKLTWIRYSKVYLEAKFYNMIGFIIFLIAGYESLNLKSLFDFFFNYAHHGGNGFTGSFLIFYLFIPFYNTLINAMNKKKHAWFIIALLFVNTIFSTFFHNTDIMKEPVWYTVLYFVASYIRLYPPRWSNNNKICSLILIVSFILSILSILCIDFLGIKFGFDNVYYMLADSNKLLAFTNGLFIFLFFKNLKMKPSKIINNVAQTAFGVLCIHANSDAMRKFLWKDFLDIPGHFGIATINLIVFCFVSAICIFAICSFIDFIRIYLLEKPLFKFLFNKKSKIDNFGIKIYNCIKG